MPSPTVRSLSPADVGKLARASFGPSGEVTECAELSGGGFAAVWRVRLADGRETVLKVSPPPDVPVLVSGSGGTPGSTTRRYAGNSAH
jgi:hypothetical protein